jgi:hypothetical protein
VCARAHLLHIFFYLFPMNRIRMYMHIKTINASNIYRYMCVCARARVHVRVCMYVFAIYFLFFFPMDHVHMYVYQNYQCNLSSFKNWGENNDNK